MTGDTHPNPTTGPAASLSSTARELERHVAAAGWDGPVRVFALVLTAAALLREPGLRAQLSPAAVDAAGSDPYHLTSIEQEDLPEAATLEELLAQIAWPATVDGAAIVVERVVVPPEVEGQMPADSDRAVQWLQDHPARQDVRMAVAVLRDGPNACALRTRSNDDDTAVAVGADLVPGLVHALDATLQG